MPDDLVHMAVHRSHEIIDILIFLFFPGCFAFSQYIPHNLRHPVPCRKHTVDAGGCKAEQIKGVKQIGYAARSPRTLLHADLRYLIADGIENDTWMVVVLPHHGGDILPPTGVKRQTVIIV